MSGAALTLLGCFFGGCSASVGAGVAAHCSGASGMVPCSSSLNGAQSMCMQGRGEQAHFWVGMGGGGQEDALAGQCDTCATG